MSEPMRLGKHDLYSAKVDDFLDEREAMKRAMPEVGETSRFVRVVMSGWFYMAIAGAVGALVAWAVLEPFISDVDLDDNPLSFQIFGVIPVDLIFPTVTASVGLFLGFIDGLMCRNLPRALICGLVGLGVGFIGGLFADVLANILFILSVVVMIMVQGPPVPGVPFEPKGLGMLVFMVGRGLAWSVGAIPAGISQGIALRSGRMVLNGFLGAMLGGFLGGILFDPIALLFPDEGGEAALSRGIGFACIGLLVGLFIGLVEQFTKSAWVLMKAGPLAGKQFIMYKNPTVLGSSPKADIYLFKDDAIEPRHALIHNRGGRFEIEDLETPDGTYVNGIPIKRQMLQAGDQIVLGKTVLEFAVKDAG